MTPPSISLAARRSGEVPTGLGRVFGAAGIAAGIGGRLGKVLGNRDAALAIGHFFGHKFKPWERSARKPVAALFSERSPWSLTSCRGHDNNRTKDWDAKRDAVAEQVEVGQPRGRW